MRNEAWEKFYATADALKRARIMYSTSYEAAHDAQCELEALKRKSIQSEYKLMEAAVNELRDEASSAQVKYQAAHDAHNAANAELEIACFKQTIRSEILSKYKDACAAYNAARCTYDATHKEYLVAVANFESATTRRNKAIIERNAAIAKCNMAESIRQEIADELKKSDKETKNLI